MAKSNPNIIVLPVALRIMLSNSGGPLDSVVVARGDCHYMTVTNALIEMLKHCPLGEGDTITIREEES